MLIPFISLLFIAISSTAQLPARESPGLAFEVASVKPNKSVGGSYLIGCYHPGSVTVIVPKGMCIAKNVSLLTIIAQAYNLPPFSAADLVMGGPGWISTEKYDLEAKAENPDATEAELRTMLQTLLTERFKLKLHEESKEVSGLRLVLGKNGPKLKSSSREGRSSIAAFAGAVGLRPVEVEAINASMADLVAFLSRGHARVPIVDKTELSGRYDFKVHMPEEESAAPSTAAQRTNGRTVVSIDESSLPAFATAIQEQLGLKLESAKLPRTVWVIDQVQKLIANNR